MLQKYGDTRTHSYAPSMVQQTVPRADDNAVLVQELLAAQKREFDEFKQTVLASLPGRANRNVPQAIMPFIARLNIVPIPTGFVLPQFKQYNGIEDPHKHIKGFLAQLTITTNDMDIYAKTFPNSLTGAALDWYMELPANFINSYARTAEAFSLPCTTHPLPISRMREL
ncbi:hypothetical protein LIER_25803 [Lithospermum erythrorhizon]|uniref:Retrotransposon gag domain-containing protein n=1 Tax=Lithospermum erythrorhizon TaxID=34254 RepID=A0AAV3RC11_LITER